VKQNTAEQPAMVFGFSRMEVVVRTMLSRLFPGLFRKSHYEMKDQHGGHVCPDCRGSGKNQQGEVCGRCSGFGEIGQQER
jgi:hypothetical protein